MLVALLCLEHTRELRVATGAIVAFARSPMLVAQGAWDLQGLSGGRFELGLGSQVKGNLEGRFGVAWTPPAPRMRDYVRALRAVFARCMTGAVDPGRSEWARRSGGAGRIPTVRRGREGALHPTNLIRPRARGDLPALPTGAGAARRRCASTPAR
jgi:alkanesulfonate monooxygenase SsuD/methylene tetrahydromethanopterin reductase-like flavin-dependent oxidoreductase (luciferase family)